MPSNRTPVKPAQRSQVSTAALDAFERMLELERKCGCGGTGCRCPICTEWQARHSILCDELHLKPWQWPVTEPPLRGLHQPRGAAAPLHAEGGAPSPGAGAMIKDTPIRALQDKPPTWRLEIDATAKETLAARLEATARTSQADYQRTIVLASVTAAGLCRSN